MDVFWKAMGTALVGVVLTLALERQSKDFSLLLTLTVCGLMAIAALTFLSPVLDYLGDLCAMADLQQGMLYALLKVFGIGMSGEIAASVCADAGNTSLGKGIRFLSNAAILYLSIPIFSSLMDLIRQILSEV